MGAAIRFIGRGVRNLVALFCAYMVFELNPEIPIPTAPKVAPVVGLPADDEPDDDTG